MKVDVNEVLNQLAKTFNVAVEEIYPILYKQAILSGIFSLSWAVMFTVLIGVFAFSIKFIIKKQKEETTNYDWDWDEPRAISIVVVGSIITLIGCLVIPFSMENAITALFNTDYYVLKDLLNQIK